MRKPNSYHLSRWIGLKGGDPQIFDEQWRAAGWCRQTARTLGRGWASHAWWGMLRPPLSSEASCSSLMWTRRGIGLVKDGFELTISGWWFGTWILFFQYIGNNTLMWLIFFRGVETTNQIFSKEKVETLIDGWCFCVGFRLNHASDEDLMKGVLGSRC